MTYHTPIPKPFPRPGTPEFEALVEAAKARIEARNPIAGLRDRLRGYASGQSPLQVEFQKDWDGAKRNDDWMVP